MSTPTPVTDEPKSAEFEQPRAILRPRKARPFFSHHPWVLDSAIERIIGSPAEGDVVDLYSDRGQFIARGCFNPHSRIRLRLYSWLADESLTSDEFWRKRLSAAAAVRRELGYDDPQNAVRLVSSEGDYLSGLVVERFAEHVVVQVTAQSIASRLGQLIPLMAEVFRPQSITLRTSREMNKAEGISLVEGAVWGTPPEGPVFFQEHGIRYAVELTGTQKTGFYLDQRENRRAAARYAAGRRVLDVCCYTGAFALCAAKLGGAQEVLGIDSSASAIRTAQAHAELNGVTNVHFEVADAFGRLDALVAGGKRFGAVILDPPKLAHHHRAVDEALRAYHHLNRQAVRLLEAGGVLVTCSCSGHVTRDDLLMTLADVGRVTGRDIQVLEIRGAAPDHPVSASCLESEYLKCIVCRVA